MPKLTKEEKRWQAEQDAHTLAAAEEIAADKTRLGAAKTEATRMAEAAVKRANRYVKVAKTPVGVKPAPKMKPKARPKPKPKAKPKAKPVAKKAAPKRAAAKSSPRGGKRRTR